MKLNLLILTSRLVPTLAIGLVGLSACSGGSPVVESSPSPTSSISPGVQVVTLSPTEGAVPVPSPSATIAVATPTITPTNAPSATSPKTSSGIQPLEVSPPTSNCAVKMAVVEDPDGTLNVRSAPDAQANNIVGKLNTKAFVTVTAEQEGWFKIETPLAGWIAKNRTRYSCAQVDQTIALTSAQPEAIVTGEIIGSGSHLYRLHVNAGQTLSLENQGSVLPRVLDPKNQSLNETLASTDAKSWSTIAKATGDYLLQLDSNFRGFAYRFRVSVR